ncbi:Abi-alpha family protein [Patulibacter defluvii]|uniref:Abi-alpha family protein n=1 Tax=Patulibacter defluvii TaxID=3095358 RepID=UPI002A753846|nr:Abi-alpha family protein [Patulibacter sp. DM4]
MLRVLRLPIDIADSMTRAGVRELRRGLGLDRDEARPAVAAPTAPTVVASRPVAGANGHDRALADRFGRLLEASSATGAEDGRTAALLRVVEQLTPDEARVLRLLAERGPQPTLDVRVRDGRGGGETAVLAGATLAVREAGVRSAVDPAVLLADLDRLGLAAISAEPLEGDRPYEVLEAQPEVTNARARKRSRMVRGRLALTPLGCELARAAGLDAGAE